MSNGAPILPNDSRPVQVSKAALTVFWFSIVAALGFFLVVPALAVLVAALVVRRRIATRPEIRGQKYASAAVIVSACSIPLGIAALLMIPCMCGPRELSNRASCAANLREFVMAMNVYASDNAGVLPVVIYAPYSPSLNNVSENAVAISANDTISGYSRAPNPQAGSVQACLWMLALREDVSPKQFICKSDPFAGNPSLIGNSSLIKDEKGIAFDNFQNGHQLSYSIAYPWKADGTVGNWWKATKDASLPLMADMTPEQGTGAPARNLTPAGLPKDSRTWNSGNHQGEGQTVAFSDGHAEWTRQPNVGQNNDNIYSISGTPSPGPAQFGGIPAGKHPFSLTADHAPFDSVMVPVRNETTGGM